MDGSESTVANDDVTDLDGILSHFGIKGMKWGIRRKNPSASAPVSDDAKAHKEVKKQIKTSGTKSLSNKELKDYLERMDLEARYQKANPSVAKKARKEVADLLLQVGKKEAAAYASKQVAAALARQVVGGR